MDNRNTPLVERWGGGGQQFIITRMINVDSKKGRTDRQTDRHSGERRRRGKEITIEKKGRISKTED